MGSLFYVVFEEFWSDTIFEVPDAEDGLHIYTVAENIMTENRGQPT
jgi:hypothetical protein